ncbi:LamG-like jellyroll fold domain-containing protein [Kribbella catacumbae]|uniref:LamG-like jellyroll fold domain-containing protein n=1 Tax=Kribbella catacumbae TaxID=460086 RepID=UPI0003670E20|nr:LamG-like jellyroll fold domain-containing protein [Kribbella catacumbae]
MKLPRVLGALNLLLPLSLAMGGLAVPSSAAADPATAGNGQLVDAQAPPDPAGRALAEARQSGRRVEVVSQRSESRDVFANPDGSFTAELRVKPIRVRRGGGWLPVNTNLGLGKDSSVRPAATTVPVTFSGGGDQPLVRLGSSSGQIIIRWPAPLPKPVLSGDTATYAEVLPGVDLRLRATANGFSKVLVVKNRTAATSAALRAIAFGFATDGLARRSDRQGNTGVYDRSGKLVFGAGAPMMWDSGTPARRAVGALSFGSGTVTLVPDQSLLTDPAAKFPLHLDPDFHAGQTGFAMVFSGKPANAYWGGDGDGVAKVGQCYRGVPDYCNGIGAARSYFQYDTAALVGKHILSAEFNAFENYAPSCTAKPVQAWGTDPVGPGTTWNSQPWWSGVGIHLGTANVAYGRSNCAANWVGFNATGIVSWSAGRGYSTSTVMLKAEDEGEMLAWKKFATNPTLKVVYNTIPNAPAGQTVAGKPCAVQPNEPYTDDTTPALGAVVSDPDGGLVRAQFEYYTRFGGKLGERVTGYQSSGTTFTVDVPAGVYTDGSKVAYRVRGFDGTDSGPWGAWCDVTIDRTAPAVAPKVSSTTYPECDLGGGIGRTGQFTFDAQGVTDIVGFRYGLSNDQTPDYVPASAPGGQATVQLTPADDKPTDLYVRGIDKAGNQGPIYKSTCSGVVIPAYHFLVGQGTGPVGHWPLDGINESVVYDQTSRNHDGPFNLAGATWKSGRHGDSLWFNGTSGQVTTTNGRTVDTTRTFAISAWAKLDRVGGWPAIVSQDGNRVGGFQLQATPGGHWAFAMFSADVDGGGTAHARVLSAMPAAVGVWTHLVAVRDVGRNELRLYVDGRLSATTPATTAWSANGPLTIGRSKWSGQASDFWPGSIDEVRAYDRSLSVGEIHDLATVPATEELFLPLDDGAGTTASEVSGNYRPGSLTGGVSWVGPPGKVGTSSLLFDGTGAVTTSQSAVRTDRSFTVTALARLDEADPDNDPGTPKPLFQTVLSQEGPRSSGFALQYLPSTRKWAFVLSEQDADAPRWLSAQSALPARAGEWVHLAGVYDVAAGEARLYVNGQLAGSQPAKVLANVAGNVVLGRAKQGNQGGSTAHLSGMVDDVHVWTGVRTSDQIAAEMNQPVTQRLTARMGQLSRYWSYDGYHIVTTGPVSPNMHFEGSLGVMALAGAEGTQEIYSCRVSTVSYFLSTQANCEGFTKLGVVGHLYTAPQPNLPTAAIYRCQQPGNGRLFATHDPNCEGGTSKYLLGYAGAFHKLTRSVSRGQGDHLTSGFATSGDYQAEGGLGLVSMWGQSGTTPLMICRDGSDTFSSTDSACEGKSVVRATGSIWTAPPDGVTATAELFRCRTATAERFDSLDPDCEGQTLDRSLGFVVTVL